MALTREDFTTRWRARRDELARLRAQVDGATLCNEVLADFEAVTASEDEALVGLQEASERSGYSTDHLRRLARLNRLPVTKRGRRLFFRVADLPKKASNIDAPALRGYDPVADARQVATQPKE
jgi:hypothetical protein